MAMFPVAGTEKSYAFFLRYCHLCICQFSFVFLLHQTHVHGMLPHIHHLIHLQALGHLVGNKNHRHLALEPIDRLRKMLSGLLIQIGNRLVENQHLGALQ